MEGVQFYNILFEEEPTFVFVSMVFVFVTKLETHKRDQVLLAGRRPRGTALSAGSRPRRVPVPQSLSPRNLVGSLPGPWPSPLATHFREALTFVELVCYHGCTWTGFQSPRVLWLRHRGWTGWDVPGTADLLRGVCAGVCGRSSGPVSFPPQRVRRGGTVTLGTVLLPSERSSRKP